MIVVLNGNLVRVVFVVVVGTDIWIIVTEQSKHQRAIDEMLGFL